MGKVDTLTALCLQGAVFVLFTETTGGAGEIGWDCAAFNRRSAPRLAAGFSKANFGNLIKR
ncbi:hypothetical protein [Caproicibacter sp.]|uniref:hypothetical protein n=1 Tax=Caproicibacter sp. TaxID=2814884 RepID=UPI00398A295B